MRVVLVHNTRAGDALPPEELRRAIEEAGHEVVREVAKGEPLALEAEEAAELVAIAGGDGTVGDVARALAGAGVPLAVLPLGTANNIARSLGVSGEPAALARGWSPGARRVRFDLGVAEAAWGRKRFLEGAGAGLIPTAIALAQQRGKRRLARSGGGPLEGARKIYRRALKDLKPARFSVSADGERLDGEYLLVQTLNIPRVGPNLELAPDADPSDGFLDLVLAQEAERGALRAFLEGENGDGPPPAALPVRRARRVELSNGGALHVDDEVRPSGEAETLALTVQTGGVEFLV